MSAGTFSTGVRNGCGGAALDRLMRTAQASGLNRAAARQRGGASLSAGSLPLT